MNSPQESDPYREDRIALLKYYNSQCMTHAGYFISILLGIVVALSTLLSEYQEIAKVILVIPKFIVIPATLSFGILILILLFGCVYALCGIFYWGKLATAVIYVPVTKLSETKKKLSEEKKIEPTRLLVLHTSFFEKVANEHPTIVRVKNISQKPFLEKKEDQKEEKEKKEKK